jgi:NAD(P)-dependent dehydrogenase (short-subunit alcohol dehydrogenase family)
MSDARRDHDITRRHFLQATGAVAVSPLLTDCSRGATGDPAPPFPGAKPPVKGPFGAKSTAEEVTQGIDLKGKTVLITGVNSGIGQETMRVLALRGAHVLGTARTLEKAKAACAEIQGQCTPLALELEDFDSVVACANQVRELGMPLDALVCNAGIMALPKLEQLRGIEKQFAVNHLGHFILVNRLISQVQAAPQGRVVVVSSGAYKSAPAAGIEFDNLSGEHDYQPNKAYGQSKLANQLMSRELARRLKDTRATSNAIHPGVIFTNLGRHFPEWKLTMARLIGWTFMKTVPQGAATTCYVATNPALAGVTGYYFQDCNPIKLEAHGEDDALAAKLWSVSEAMTKAWLA